LAVLRAAIEIVLAPYRVITPDVWVNSPVCGEEGLAAGLKFIPATLTKLAVNVFQELPSIVQVLELAAGIDACATAFTTTVFDAPTKLRSA
jgi:hypothetical protein